MNRSAQSSITWYDTPNGEAHLVPWPGGGFSVVTFDGEGRMLDHTRPMPLEEAEHYARSLKC